MDLEPPGGNYVKPFYLYHYNQTKLPPLEQPKVIKLEKTPRISVKSNNATKLRDKNIKVLLGRDKKPSLSLDILSRISAEPQFTEHLMMYRKPPFTFETGAPGVCSRYRLRTIKLIEPVGKLEEADTEEEFLPGILQ